MDSQNRMEKGVLYVASGKKYVDEATVSAKSLKKHMPHIPSILYTDDPTIVEEDVFFAVNKLEAPLLYTQGDKILPMCDTPFAKTIFLDSDTYVVNSFEDVFDVLGKYDFAITHDAGRIRTPVDACPDCFPEFNSGVIGIIKNERTDSLIKRWKEMYLEQYHSTGNKSDQGVLRKALYDNDVSTYVLPQEYNFRTKTPGFIGRGIKARIIHGRGVDMDYFAYFLNRYDAKKVVIPGFLLPNTCEVAVPVRPFGNMFYYLSMFSRWLYKNKKIFMGRWKRRLSKLRNMSVKK